MCTFIVAYVSLAIPTVNIEGGERLIALQNQPSLFI